MSSKIKVEYAFQELEPVIEAGLVPSDRVKTLGTTHALLAAEDVLKEGFAVINSDDFYGREAFAAGALKALQWAKGRNPGIYTMRDVLGFA